MAHKVTFSIFSAINRLEAMKGHAIEQVYIAQESGLARPTVAKWLTGKASRAEADTIAAWYSFFESEGMPITHADIFTVATVTDD